MAALPREILEEDWPEQKRKLFRRLEEFERNSLDESQRGKRQLRLFACGCCRLIWQHMNDPRLQQVVEIAERFADAQATAKQLSDARWVADGTLTRRSSRGYAENDPHAQENTLVALVVATTNPHAPSAAFNTTSYPLPLAGYRGNENESYGLMGEILQDIFGNPFRPVAFAPEWRTSTAAAIARQMYESRDFGAMPILADALQDAGCDADDILNHCRDTAQVHVRGCWVVDLVLGKA